MSKMIQIRNVPEKTHRTLKSRAAQLGMSLSDYLSVELERLAQRPTNAELWQRLMTRTPVRLDPPPEVLIREDRDRR